MTVSDEAVRQWKLNCAGRSTAYDAGLRDGHAAALTDREYDPAGVTDERYASSYRTGWDQGWIRAVHAAERGRTGKAVTPPKLPASLYGHARLDDRKNSHMGGPAQVTLYGTPDEPQVYASTPDSFSGISLVPRREDLIRFAREVLAFLGEGYGAALPPWRPATDRAGQRAWYLTRYDGDGGRGIPLTDRYCYGAGGNLVRYATAAGAQYAAGQLNRKEHDESQA